MDIPALTQRLFLQYQLTGFTRFYSSSTTYLQARTWEVRLGFVPASQLEALMGLEEACWDPSFLKKQIWTDSLKTNGTFITQNIKIHFEKINLVNIFN